MSNPWIRRLLFIPLAALLAVLAPACSSSSDLVVLKLGHALDRTHPVHLGMAHMAALVEKRSQGRRRVEIYANEQLGDERELLELLQIGAVSLAKVGGMVLENFHPAVGVFNLPYLFKDEDHFWSVLEGEIGNQLLRELGAYGFKGLCYYDSGSRSFYTHSRPILKPTDLQGLKIRVPNSGTAIEMIRRLGGAATPIAFGELYSALQQGIVDGAENNPPSFFTSRHFEVCSYYVLDQHTRVPDFLLMSLEVWNGLSPEFQEILQQAASDSVSFQRQAWKDSVARIMEELEQAGVEILRPDRDPFRAAVRGMLKDYEDRFGGTLKAIRDFE